MIDDFALFLASRSDDPVSFRLLYQRYWKSLYISACKKVDPDDAKDLVQEVMLTLWRRKNEIKISNSDDLSRYLFKALKYRIISFYTYGTSTIRMPEWFDSPSTVTSDSHLDVTELKGIIDTEVRKMPARMKEIFTLSREEDLSIPDIANHLSLSEQTVKNQLTLAMKRLRATLQSSHSDIAVCALITYAFIQK